MTIGLAREPGPRRSGPWSRFGHELRKRAGISTVEEEKGSPAHGSDTAFTPYGAVLRRRFCCARLELNSVR